MSNPDRMAFKEWAVIIEALARGQQALILRKGGIAESNGEFTPDYPRFWLYPTYVHQQRDGIKPGALPLMDAVLAQPHDPARVPLCYTAEVTGAFQVRDEASLQQLDRLHIWSPEVVRQRFHYRQPGIYVLPVRVRRVDSTRDHPVRPEYEGCKTWVDLGEEVATQPATPVIGDRAYHDFLETLDHLLHPRGMA